MGTFALLERFEVAYAAALDISPRFKAQGPDGLLAITAMDFFPRFLPDHIGLGHPGFEARIHAALNEDHRRPDRAPRPSMGCQVQICARRPGGR